MKSGFDAMPLFLLDDLLIVPSNPFPLLFRVRKVTTDGRLSLVAGREAECNCLDASCPCYDPGHFLASNVHFSAISAITVTPDSVLTIADQGNYRLRSLSSGMFHSIVLTKKTEYEFSRFLVFLALFAILATFLAILGTFRPSAPLL